jgi:predicted dehydrogenase
MPVAPYRIGIIGTGNIAHVHIAGYRTILGDRGTVTAVCDPRTDVAAAFQAKYGVDHLFADARELIEADVADVLVLLTPPAVRDEVIYPALDAGIPILVEKPFGTDGVKAVEYVRAAADRSVPIAVGQNFRWFPEHQWMRKVLDAGTLGAQTFIEARSFQDRPQQPGQWRAAERKLEMAIFSVHLIDRLQWLSPAIPTTVSAVTREDPEYGIEGEQFTSLIVAFSDGMVGQMTSSWRARALPVNSMRVDLTGGSIAVERPNPMHGDAVGRFAARGADRVEEESFPDTERLHARYSYGHSMAAFLDSLRAGTEPPHSGRNNLRTMGIMEAAYMSAARDGSAVTVTEALGGHELDAPGAAR